jgi:hypothetical protein
MQTLIFDTFKTPNNLKKRTCTKLSSEGFNFPSACNIETGIWGVGDQMKIEYTEHCLYIRDVCTCLETEFCWHWRWYCSSTVALPHSFGTGIIPPIIYIYMKRSREHPVPL